MPESRITVAPIQAAPVFLDLEASLRKALALIETAAANGARLLVFPEAFLPAWPAWVDDRPKPQVMSLAASEPPPAGPDAPVGPVPERDLPSRPAGGVGVP